MYFSAKYSNHQHHVGFGREELTPVGSGDNYSKGIMIC